MLIPSTLGLVIAAVLIAVVAASDWYVWGLNSVSNPRQPRHPQPLTGLELVDLALGRLIDANKTVLPKAAFASAQAHGAQIANDPDDGFKRVA